MMYWHLIMVAGPLAQISYDMYARYSKNIQKETSKYIILKNIFWHFVFWSVGLLVLIDAWHWYA